MGDIKMRIFEEIKNAHFKGFFIRLFTFLFLAIFYRIPRMGISFFISLQIIPIL